MLRGPNAFEMLGIGVMRLLACTAAAVLFFPPLTGPGMQCTYTRLAPYLGTPKLAMATFILQVMMTDKQCGVSSMLQSMSVKLSGLSLLHHYGGREHNAPALAADRMHDLRHN